ncbi:hypothetical protein H7E67_03920 [Clostridium gasigenes]|uniref:phage tail assembly chaperone G n=1 Tax=Clostridium gasigenes TaxID=94869 RepID=UPI001625E4E8|nr:hypothetical protein [Clostridium gasigenes]MBB6622570.1 hypothetical protein [Clostridium gasigenes]
MKIKLGSKEYVQPAIMGIMVKKTLELNKVFQEKGKNIGEDEIDLIVDYVVLAFGNRFTGDDLLSYNTWNEVQDLVKEISEMAMGKVAKKSPKSKK